MAKNLIYYLEQIPDPRDKSGLRHPLPIISSPLKQLQ